MLLCSRHPNAVRVRASQGDGGIDIFIPGPAGWGKERAVWQIKRYCHNLTGTEKRAIKSSFSRVGENSRKEGWRITEWHLVMPLDLTTQNLGWLDSYTESADFPRETHGLLFCDTLAADYPRVIDYYLRDGKERLQAAMDNLTRILSGRTDRKDNEPLAPTDVMSDLASIHKALNEYDPFYKYDFAASDAPPSDDFDHTEEGLVAVCATNQDAVWITIKIFARSLAALEERPISAQFQLAIPADDDDLHNQLQKFIDYGAPMSMPAGTVSGSLDLPGGLGGDLSGASLLVINVIERVEAGEETELVIAMLEPDADAVIASTTIKRTEWSSGQGDGFRSVWSDTANLFTIEMLGRKGTPRELTWNIQVEYNLHGRRPSEIVDSLKFLAAMHQPNRIGIGLTYGPKTFSNGGTAPYAQRDAEAGRWSVIAEALALIQDHVTTRLLMPAQMTKDQAFDIITAAKLLSGEFVTGTMSGHASTIHHDQPQPEFSPEIGVLYEFATVKETDFVLGDDEITVGKEVLYFRGRYLEIGEDKSKMAPEADSEGVTVCYTGELPPGRVLGRHVPGVADTDAPADMNPPATDEAADHEGGT
jgi:hypothetical protein